MYYDMNPARRINEWIHRAKESTAARIRQKLIAKMESVAPNDSFSKDEVIRYMDEILKEVCDENND